MITEFKLFEELNTKIQQPFFLVGDMLYVSNELAHKMTPTKEDYTRIDNPRWAEYMNQQNIDFFAGTRDEKGYLKSNHIGTYMSVGYGLMYKMNLSIHRGNVRDNEFGHFEFYIGGNSGSHDMGGKNMTRATRECNLHLMEKLYPVVANIKDFYKKMKNKEGFFDIIRNAILKNHNIAKDGVPDELEEEFGHITMAHNYNL